MEIGYIRRLLRVKERRIFRAKTKLARLEAERDVLRETLEDKAMLNEEYNYEFIEQ